MQYNTTDGKGVVTGLTLKPRWVHPLNFREEDKAVLDAAVLVAKNEGSNLTNVIRDALRVYTDQKLQGDVNQKLDKFVNESYPHYRKMLTPEELSEWADADILDFARLIRARKQEIEFELKKRGYYFQW
ncbi:MAG TPA: hypothetical protein VN739_10265 [Nitrososphaerales archaeon]|nr:hypothetical protein [Nitrososphaerales archaeon]